MKNRNAVLDELHDNIDALMRRSEFAAINDLIAMAKVAFLETDVLVCLLVATLPCRTRLPARTNFFREVSAELANRGESKDVLSGLA